MQAQFDTWDKLGQDVEHILFYTKDAKSTDFLNKQKKLEEKNDKACGIITGEVQIDLP